MKNTILFDVQEYLENAYPSLSDSEIDLISSDITRRWDYSLLTNNVEQRIKECAMYANIDLKSTFNTESVANISDNEADVFDEVSKPEPMEHTSEGC